MTNSFSLKEIQLRFGIPQHVLIHLCEKGVIHPDISDPQGRGKSREFSQRNVFEFAIALELRKYEMPLSRIGAILKVLEAFEKAVQKSVPGFELPASLQGNAPSLLFYLFDGDLAVFALGKNSLITFRINKLLDGDVKKVQIESLKALPTEYSSYLKLDLQSLASDI